MDDGDAVGENFSFIEVVCREDDGPVELGLVDQVPNLSPGESNWIKRL